MLVVLCGDLSGWETQVKNIWADAAEPVQQYMIPAVDSYYRGKPQTQRDEIMRSAGILPKRLCWRRKRKGTILVPWTVLILMPWEKSSISLSNMKSA